ncbi:condensation domain-containing protein [Streptomyces sp. NPDC047070]|uniref:condensation domain-containing protein n=1 Tax=Streptomyces sp. NPDC047070 TaxID=3154923 RepID=UPI003455935B
MHDIPQAPYTPQVPSPRQHPADSPRREPSAPATLAPASFAQRRLWFLAQLPGGNEAYNEPVTSTLRGPLDTDALRRALDALVVRQQALRGGRMGFALDTELNPGLRTLARQHGRTLFGSVLTGRSLLMSRLSGRTDVVVGTPTAGRRHNEVTAVLGAELAALSVAPGATPWTAPATAPATVSVVAEEA